MEFLPPSSFPSSLSPFSWLPLFSLVFLGVLSPSPAAPPLPLLLHCRTTPFPPLSHAILSICSEPLRSLGFFRNFRSWYVHVRFVLLRISLPLTCHITAMPPCGSQCWSMVFKLPLVFSSCVVPSTGVAVVWAFCCFSLVFSAFLYFAGFSLPTLQLYYLLVVASPSSLWLLVLFVEVWLPWWLPFSLFQCIGLLSCSLQEFWKG